MVVPFVSQCENNQHRQGRKNLAKRFGKPWYRPLEQDGNPRQEAGTSYKGNHHPRENYKNMRVSYDPEKFRLSKP